MVTQKKETKTNSKTKLRRKTRNKSSQLGTKLKSSSREKWLIRGCTPQKCFRVKIIGKNHPYSGELAVIVYETEKSYFVYLLGKTRSLEERLSLDEGKLTDIITSVKSKRYYFYIRKNQVVVIDKGIPQGNRKPFNDTILLLKYKGKTKGEVLENLSSSKKKKN